MQRQLLADCCRRKSGLTTELDAADHS
jgi:hypothetical protein